MAREDPRPLPGLPEVTLERDVPARAPHHGTEDPSFGPGGIDDKVEATAIPVSPRLLDLLRLLTLRPVAAILYMHKLQIRHMLLEFTIVQSDQLRIVERCRLGSKDNVIGSRDELLAA